MNHKINFNDVSISSQNQRLEFLFWSVLEEKNLTVYSTPDEKVDVLFLRFAVAFLAEQIYHAAYDKPTEDIFDYMMQEFYENKGILIFDISKKYDKNLEFFSDYEIFSELIVDDIDRAIKLIKKVVSEKYADFEEFYNDVLNCFESSSDSDNENEIDDKKLEIERDIDRLEDDISEIREQVLELCSEIKTMKEELNIKREKLSDLKKIDIKQIIEERLFGGPYFDDGHVDILRGHMIKENFRNKLNSFFQHD